MKQEEKPMDKCSNSSTKKKHHFILVHGLCHGAWCWYKAATMLRLAGHRVTTPDLAACGGHAARVTEVRSFEEYSRSLLAAVAAVPPGELVVLVGHSHAGYSLPLAMERFPDKIAAAVFATAAFPAAGCAMAATTEEYSRRLSLDFFMDSEELVQENPQIPGKPLLFGPNFLAEKLYHLSQPEDITLTKMLMRPGNRFTEDAVMRDDKILTDERYGSVRRVFVVVKDDLSISEEFQRWMIAQNPGTEVQEIAGADHMVMLSKPREFVDLLVGIANKYK